VSVEVYIREGDDDDTKILIKVFYIIQVYKYKPEPVFDSLSIMNQCY